MVTCGGPDAAGVAGNAGAELALEAALDGDAAALDDGPAALLSLEQPAMPATIAAAPTAINSSRLTGFSLYWIGARIPSINACVSSQVGRTPDARTSSKLGAAASRSDNERATPSITGQSIARVGSMAQMVCSRCGLYSDEHRYMMVELSSSARNPCASPSEI